jgi:hypothetical protein
MVKRVLVEEAGGCCAICGYDRCIVNLHFHHVRPEEKSLIMSSSTTKSLAAYREELEKCVLVCANCHGEIEARLISSPPAGAAFEDVLYRYAWRLGIAIDEERQSDGTEGDGPPGAIRTPSRRGPSGRSTKALERDPAGG